MKNKIQKHIDAKWDLMTEQPTLVGSIGYKKNHYQTQFYKIKDAPYQIGNGATAGGKSLGVCFNGTYALKNGLANKMIIAAPQTTIFDGFRGEFELINDDGSIDYWCPRHYLLGPKPQTNIVSILHFLQLKGDKLPLNDRILVTSYNSLVAAFKAVPELLLKNNLINIDECHHVQCAHDGLNCLGELVEYIFQNKGLNTRLTFTTATWCRGDGQSIIPAKYHKEFAVCHVPLDEYLKRCRYVKQFQYNFVFYKHSYTERLKELLQDRREKHIVYIPNVHSTRFSKGTKYQDVDEIYKALNNGIMPTVEDKDDGLTLVTTDNGDVIKCVNLVDVKRRRKKVKLIEEAHRYKVDNTKIDLIITLNMFIEGANWKWANHVVIIGAKNSVPQIAQIPGRLLRDAEDKHSVKIDQLLPFSFDQLDDDTIKANINDFCMIYIALMSVEDAITPLIVQEGGKVTSDPKAVGEKLRNPLLSIMDETRCANIVTEILMSIIRIHESGVIDFANRTSHCNAKKRFNQISSDVLLKYKIDKDLHADVSKYLWSRWTIETLKKTYRLKMDDVNINDESINPVGFGLDSISVICDEKTIKRAKNLLVNSKEIFVNYEEWIKYVNENLAPLGMKSRQDYRIWARKGIKGYPPRPDCIPSDPQRHYSITGEWKK